LVAAGALALLVVGARIARAGGEGGPPPPKVNGRMTGGGNFQCVNGAGDTVKTTHGFELHCDVTDASNNLEVNWDGHQFHMETYDTAMCFDNPLIDQAPPNAPLDTLVMTGTGRLDGNPGATVSATLVDAGEPGTSDTITITIKNAAGATVLSCTNVTLDGGNHQAHKETGNEP
jgi:hypothetical protein